MPVIDEVVSKMEPADAGPPARANVAEVQRFVSHPRFTVRHTATGGCNFDDHAHALYTATAILSGTMSVAIGGEEHELSEGEIALTNIGQPHKARSAGVEFVSIGISPALVGELVLEMGLARSTSDIVFRSSAVKDEAIMSAARRVAAEMAGEEPGHGAMLDAIVRQLVIHLLRTHLTVRKSSQIELSRAGPVDRRLRRAVEFMHDNFGRELSLEEIASAAYLSEYHFARLFKQITGVTPHVYLANLRIERARRLLVETRLAISEVAAEVGYQSQSHFTKVFKSVTGLTPRAYRDSATN